MDDMIKKIEVAIEREIDVFIDARFGTFFGKLPKDKNENFEKEGVFIQHVSKIEEEITGRIPVSHILSIREVKLFEISGK